MSAAPLVSVIMPCFNAGVMLRPALASVIRQTYSALEIIFVDNNSTDGSLELATEVLAAQPRPFQILSCRQQGVNHARNLGYGRVQGAFVQWMDSDDELAPDKIALQVSAMLSDSGVDIAYGDWAEFRMREGRVQSHRAHVLTQVNDQVERTLAGIWYPPHLYLLRRAASDRLQAERAWWPGRPVATDVEYSAMAALLGLRFRHVPNARVRYNLWSSDQIGSATNYTRRVASLDAIYRRLRKIAKTSTLTARQTALLEQDWTVWRLDSSAVAISPDGPDRFQLVQRNSGKALLLSAQEASVVTALFQTPQALAMPHLVLRLIEGLPALGRDPVRALEIINRLRSKGFLVRG